MWRDTARDFLDIPKLIFSLCAPLSRPMVEHLVLLECQQYRRAVISSWPAREEVWERVLERVQRARTDVCEYMDVLVQDDIKQANEKGRERAFPDDEWILEQLAAYPPYAQFKKKGLEDWQSRNILRKAYPGSSRWKLDDVAALLIMRLVNTTHQKGWLPSEIPPDEPRWWAFGKDAPDGSVQPIPIPLQGGEEKPCFLWTPRIGASWDNRWQRHHGISVCWSRPFKHVDEVAVWHTVYAQEIRWIFGRGSIVSSTELRLSQEGVLMPRPNVQAVVRASIEQVMRDVEQALLREAENLILEEQALFISKEK